MPWSKATDRSAGVPPAVRTASRRPTKPGILSALVLVFALALLLPAAAPQKHLSVYSTAANYSLPLVQADNRDYVGLLELLEPLGSVTAKAEGSRWRIRYNNIEADFQNGKNRARMQGRDTELTGKFRLENGRGLI